MSVEKTTVDSADVDQRQWYRVGGIAALILGTAYIIIVPLYAHVGAAPTGGEAWFKYLPGKTTVWWAILGLSVLTVLASPLEIIYAIVTLSFGILVIGLVMLRGVFNKTTAYLGLVTGILGVVSVAGLTLTIIMNALCATAWILFVGYRLYRLAQE